MKKIILAISVAYALTGLLIISHIGAQDDMQAIDNAVFKDPQRSRAVFFHDLHNEKAGIEDCAECHHVYENGEKLEGESSEDSRCSDCHGIDDQNGQPGLAKAFHLNCKGCHIAVKKGPILCGECHKKE